MSDGFTGLAPEERIITALDCPRDEALRIAGQLAGTARWLKVGMTLFYAQGPAIVRELKDMGFKVFLDLKFHDIPHQARGAAASAVASGADMLTMHTCGGEEMCRAAREGASEAARTAGRGEPVTLGVTVLTSMDAPTLEGVGVTRTLPDQVRALAGIARAAGLSGVVASPQEAAMLRGALGPDAYIVTPGVRPAGSAVGDQKRVATPARAIAAGASHLVIGRPITQAADPAAAFLAVADELRAG